VHGLDRLVTAARVLGGEQRDLTALVAAAPRCAADPLLPQRRAAPQVAYLLGRAPGAIRVGGAAPARGLIFTPAPGSRAIRDRLAPTDQPAPDPRATRSARPLATRGAWAVMSSC
jgi:hypothetical protein